MTSITDIVALDALGEDRFVTANLVTNGGFLYGGQLLAQALMAACRTVEPDRLPHSLHCSFIAGGRSTEPIEFQVTRDRDGRSYSARSVSAVQDGRVLVNMLVSFQVPEEGMDLQWEARADVPLPPADFTPWPHPCSPDAQLWDPAPDPAVAHPARGWCRFASEIGDDPVLNACALAYMSDFFNGFVGQPGFPASGVAVSSLDHAIWFYRPTRMQLWHLMDWHGHSVSSGRGHYSGTIHDADGRLVAGVSQEALVRVAPPQTSA